MVQERTERRAARRRLAEIPVHFMLGKFEKAGITCNVSRSGIFVRTVRPPEVGAVVTLLLQAPNKKLTLRGKVVRARAAAALLQYSAAPGFGIRIVNPPDEYEQFLADVG